MRIPVLCLAAALSVPVWAKSIEGPFDVRSSQSGALKGEPQAVKAGTQVKISFEAVEATDTEVAILDSQGKIVRHLAAGLLGRNAPAPFKKDALAQELLWDGMDDLGRPARGGPFRARVRLGSKASLEKYLGHDPLTFCGEISAITVGAKGELYVLFSEGFKFGRAELVVLNKDGSYARTIMPYPANTPAARTESVGHVTIDGRHMPILFSPHSFSVYPLTCGMRGQSMAWHPKGFLIAASATGTAREHGPPRYLLAFHPEGGAPEGVSFVGPKLLEPRGFMGGGGERGAEGLDRIAVSPDGEYVYVSQHFDSKRFEERLWKHGVYRLKWTDAKAETLWLGKDQAGAGDEEFNDPQGIAIDKDGRLLICDRGNDRVKVYSAEGKLLGKFAVKGPEQIGIHPQSGTILILSSVSTGKKKQSEYKLFAFGPWSSQECKNLAEFTTPGIKSIAVDGSGKEARLWAAVSDKQEGDKLVPLVLENGNFAIGKPVTGGQGMVDPSFLAADPVHGRVIVKDHRTTRFQQPFTSYDVASGKHDSLDLKGADLVLDEAGNRYVMDGYASNTLSRYDSEGRPLPFAGTGSNKISLEYRGLGPDMGLFGHRVALNGDLYVLRTVDKVAGKELNVYGTDGKLKKRGLLAGMGAGDIGLGVDAQNNIYVGMNIRPGDQPFPVEFRGQVATSNRIWWNEGTKEEAPWSYIYCNPYLFGMGAVFKFGPEGGAVYGNQATKGKKDKGVASPGCDLENAPSDAVAFKSSFMTQDVRVSGASWFYGGVGPVPIGVDGPGGDPGCICMPARLDADRWGRVYAPSAYTYSVEMLDTAGNRIARIGSYGNADTVGPDGKPANPPIAFCGPVACDFSEADDRLFVSDIANHRVAVIRMTWSAQAIATLP